MLIAVTSSFQQRGTDVYEKGENMPDLKSLRGDIATVAYGGNYEGFICCEARM